MTAERGPTVEKIAKTACEAEESARAKEEGDAGVWIPWEARREQRVFRAVARAIAALYQPMVEENARLREDLDAVNQDLTCLGENTTTRITDLVADLARKDAALVDNARLRRFLDFTVREWLGEDDTHTSCETTCPHWRRSNEKYEALDAALAPAPPTQEGRSNG